MTRFRRRLRCMHPRFRLFVLGVLLALAGGVLLWHAFDGTAAPESPPRLTALPGFALYLGGFGLQFWAVFAPTPEETP